MISCGALSRWKGESQGVSSLAETIAALEIIDGHAHPCVAGDVVSLQDFTASFSESADETQLTLYSPSTVTMMAAIRFLARRLGVEATAAAIVAYRNKHGLRDYAQRILQPENVRCILLDTGYPKNSLTLGDCEDVLGVPCREVLRLETVAECILPRVDSLDSLLEDLRGHLLACDRQRVVALKTIAAYRCGLSFWRSAESARDAFKRERHRVETTGTARLTEPAVIRSIVETAFDVAAQRSWPLQVHTGFGDRDLDPCSSDPLLLRPLFEDGRFASVPIVLLHSGYPFVRSAALLAGLYPNAFVDLSLSIPLIAHGVRGLLLELLEQAPIAKLMYGSDASVGPELFAWGANVARSEITAALSSLTRRGWLTEDEAIDGARRILSENSRSLYGLENDTSPVTDEGRT